MASVMEREESRIMSRVLAWGLTGQFTEVEGQHKKSRGFGRKTV